MLKKASVKLQREINTYEENLKKQQEEYEKQQQNKGIKGYFKNLVNTDKLKEISSDGFQAKDILEYGKLGFNTGVEGAKSVARGILSTGENIGDYAAYHTANALQKAGIATDYMEEVKRATTDNITRQILAPTNNSLLGTSGQSTLEGVGNSLSNMAIGGVGGAGATYGSMFLSSAGGATTNKYAEIDKTLQQLQFQKQLATGEEKQRLQAEIDDLSKNKDKYINTYATISGLAEMGSEAMFGGIAKGLKIRGIGTGAEDDLIRYATKNISNMLARNLISAGISATGEGIEEIMSDFGEALAEKASTEKDKSFTELLADKDWLGDFMNGFMSSLITQGGETIKASRSGIDITTGLTQTESNVVKELAKEQQAKDGGKLSDIERDIENKLKEGTIKYEDIQRVLSKDTYNELDSLRQKQNRIGKLQKRIDELDKNPNEKLTSLNEYNSTKEELNQLQNEDYSRIDELTERLENETNELTKGKDGNMSGAFAQSYLDRQNRGVAYQVDEDTYNKASKELQGLYDSARRIMNNTVQARKFIDSMVKLSKSNGLNYQMTNNQELKELGKTVDGKVVNGLGYRTENGNTILINVDAADNLNTILGHETTHFTETAGNYKDYQKFLQKNFKEEYNALKEKYESIYEGLDADIDSEITAQLTGEKLFNDPKFIEKLTEKPTLFNKIKNFIDDLVTKFTGTKEEKQLKDLQKRFQEVYDKTDFKKELESKSKVETKEDEIVFEPSKVEKPTKVEKPIERKIPTRKDINNIEGVSTLRQEYQEARKETGNKKTIVLNDGEKLTGTYKLVEAGSVTPSHNSENFTKSDNFPTTESGSTINDRDYENDKTAQQLVKNKAANYDGRAFNDNGVIVTKDGIVVSGNDRTMAGEIAARNNTDSAYIEYLKDNASEYGFTEEQINSMDHPRVVLELDNNLDYDTQTFAKFNKDAKKSKSVSEKAREFSKTISNETIERISDTLQNFDRIDDLYNSQNASKELLNILLNDDIIQDNEISEYYDGNKFTGAGKDLIEATVLGNVIEEDNLRFFRNNNDLKFKIMKNAPMLIQNKTFGEYSILDEINRAIEVYKNAQQANMSVEELNNQTSLFGDSDFDLLTKKLAQIIEGKGYKNFQNFLEQYNQLAESPANGQVDMFSGDVLSKEDILQQALNISDYAPVNYSLSEDAETFTTPYGVQVVKNPSQDDYIEMRKEILDERPWLRGETILRHTYDEQGNEYYWSAYDAQHADVEPYINQRYNTRTYQGDGWWKNPFYKDMPKDYSYMNNTNYSLSQDSEGKSLNEDQKEFFKNVSPEVIDDNGNLMRFYHGSNSEFTIFDITKSGESSKEAKIGFWFTPNKKGAENFANEAWYGDKKPTTYEVYLKLENPKIYETYEVDQQQRDTMQQNMRNLEQEIRNSSHKYAWTETGDYKVTSLYNDLVEMNRREINGIKFKEDNLYNEEFYKKLAEERNISNEQFNEMLQDAKHQVELETQNRKARDEYYTYIYSDAYEQFKTELYLSAGMRAEDANVGGMGMMMKNENEAVANFVEGLKQEGYDGIVIKNTQYDNDSLGEGKNNDQYVVFYPNQIKNVDNLHPTDNPDIRYSLTDDKGRTLTQDQQIFYSNSVVRDKDGNLKTYYNGSDNFNIFNRNFMSDSSKWGKGIYLTEHEDIAKNYGKDLKEVYVNITNPLNERRKTITFDQYNALYQRLYDGEEAYREEYDMYNNDLDLLWDITNKGSWADYAEVIKETTGKDGLIIDRMDDVEDMIIAFQSNQVKRVNNLTPTEDPDIRYSLQNQNEELAPYNPNGIYGRDVRLENQQVREDIDTLRDIAPIRTDTDEEGDVLLNADIERDIAPTSLVVDTQPVPEGKGRSSYWQNVGKQDFLTDESKELIQDEDDVKYYDVVSNKETLSKAYDKLRTGGTSEVLNWNNKFQLDEKGKVKSKVTAEDVAEGWILMKQYQDDGNYDAMIQVAKTMRNMGTEAGQAVQAFNIMSRMTPEGMVKYAQSELTEAFDKASKNKSKQWIDMNEGNFDLTPDETRYIIDTMNEVQNMEDGYEKKVKLAQIQALISNKLPTNIGNEIKSWMRISMLFNPKTQVRNVAGNAVIVPVNAAADVFSSAIDRFLARKTGVRTTGTFNVKAALEGLKRGAYEATNDYKLGINTKDVNMDRFEAGQGKSFTEKTILGKTLNNTESLLNYVMDLGDRIFSEAIFENSLQNQMELNNTTEITQDMLDIARTEALQRTWNDNNNYTKFVLDIRKALNKVNFKGYGLGDVLIPFAKTPANLTKAIVDYSPVGLVNSIVKGKNLKNAIETGKFTAQQQHEFVQTLGKATAGTLLYVLGYALAKAGISTGKSDDDKDVSNFMKNTLGISSYSINVGGKSYTYDWAQPIAAPFSITANIVSSKNSEEALAESIIANLDTAGSILMEQSFLQSLNETLNNNDGVVNGLLQQALDLPARAIPTLSKQIADLTDDTQRQTYEYNEPIKTAINKMKSKIPGLSDDLAPVVDTMGREVKKYGGKNNLFNVFLNPANVNTENISSSAQEIYDLYKSTGDKTIMPRTAPYYVNKNGEKIVLNSTQKAEYQRISGGMIESQVQDLMNNTQYINMSDEEKASIVKKIVDYSYNIAQHDVLGTEISQTYQTAYLYSKVGNVNDWYLLKSQEFTSDKNSEGKTISGSLKNKVVNYVNEMDISAIDKVMLIELNGYRLSDYDMEVYNYINNMDLSYDDKLALLKKMGVIQ